MSTITAQITARIHAKRRGWVFAPKDFLDLGARAAVDQVLSRLVKQGKIRRLDRGLYDYPKQHAVLGTLSADTDKIAQAVAAKSGDTIFPSGALAANLLGLSTQVPAKPTYMTSGISRTRKMAGCTLTFKHARVPILPHLPDRANHVLQALSYMGKHAMDDVAVRQCAAQLDARDIKALNDSLSQVPGWMADVIHKIQDITQP